MSDSSFSIYRRHMPHWRLDGAIYFVTWRVHAKQSELIPAGRDLVAAALRHFNGQRYRLSAYVAMNDHIHVLVQPCEAFPLTGTVQSWKSFTAHAMQRNHGRLGAVWQGEYFDRIVRDEAEFVEKANYILGNPRKRWPEIEEYPWAWFAQD